MPQSHFTIGATSQHELWVHGKRQTRNPVSIFDLMSVLHEEQQLAWLRRESSHSAVCPPCDDWAAVWHELKAVCCHSRRGIIFNFNRQELSLVCNPVKINDSVAQTSHHWAQTHWEDNLFHFVSDAGHETRLRWQWSFVAVYIVQTALICQSPNLFARIREHDNLTQIELSIFFHYKGALIDFADTTVCIPQKQAREMAIYCSYRRRYFPDGPDPLVSASFQ